MSESPYSTADIPLEIQRVLERSPRDIILSHGVHQAGLIGEIRRQTSPDLEDLLGRMKKIRPVFCGFEHHKRGSIVTVQNCTVREINAVCGHMGLEHGQRGYRQDGPEKDNAVATMEEAMGLLETIGISCSEERDRLVSMSDTLRKYDFNEISGDKVDAQQYYASQMMRVHGAVMKKFMGAIRSIADGTLPERPDAALLKAKRIDKRWGFED